MLAALCSAMPTLARAQLSTRLMITPQNVTQLQPLVAITAQGSGVRGIAGIALSPDNRLLALAMRDGTVRLWQVQPPQELYIMRAHESAVNAVAFSPDGRFVISASNDRTIRFWDAARGTEVKQLGPARACHKPRRQSERTLVGQRRD
jgi:WD40 repeat protein